MKPKLTDKKVNSADLKDTRENSLSQVIIRFYQMYVLSICASVPVCVGVLWQGKITRFINDNPGTRLILENYYVFF